MILLPELDFGLIDRDEFSLGDHLRAVLSSLTPNLYFRVELLWLSLIAELEASGLWAVHLPFGASAFERG